VAVKLAVAELSTLYLSGSTKSRAENEFDQIMTTLNFISRKIIGRLRGLNFAIDFSRRRMSAKKLDSQNQEGFIRFCPQSVFNCNSQNLRLTLLYDVGHL
jgi:hypothetical protein